MKKDIISKIKNKHTKKFQDVLVEVLEDRCVPKIKEIILEDYEFNLNDISNPKSKLAPERYITEFSTRLDDFDFLERTSRGVKVITPEVNTFNFSGNLDIIQNILEGITGRYVEVEKDDFRRATGRSTYGGEHKDVFLIRYTDQIKEWEAKLNKKFDEYAFSNTPPIDIFGRADQYVRENLDFWISDAIEKSSKEMDL